MKIRTIISQHRRDFQAIYSCENCGETHESYGYDDRNFHDNVIPAMKCRKCKLSSNDLGTEIPHTETKYPDHLQV